jgi:hypothetical protein
LPAACVEEDDLWTQGITLYFWIAVMLPFAACWWQSKRPVVVVGTPAFAAPNPISKDVLPKRIMAARH